MQTYLRKYGVQTTINFTLFEVDGVDLRIDAVDAGTDCNIRKDQGADATCDNDFADEGMGYSLVLTATEMEAAEITLYIVDTAVKVWLDEVLKIETYGNAAAQHAFDLDSATLQTEWADGGRLDLLLDEIHDETHSIAVTGSAMNQIAESNTLAVGVETTGTYEDTHIATGTEHVLTAAANEIDIYYQFDIGASGVPVSVHGSAWLQEGVPAGGDVIDAYAYDWTAPGWEKIASPALTGIVTAGPAESCSCTLLARHVGTGENVGLVRIRFQAAALEEGTTLNVDQIFVSYAESIAADIAALPTTAEVNAEIVDALNTDTYTEPVQGTPGATISLAQKLGYLYKNWRNRKATTETQEKLYNDDAAVVDHKSTLSDDGAIFSKTEIVTGP